jgi:hypothetical protein
MMILLFLTDPDIRALPQRAGFPSVPQKGAGEALCSLRNSLPLAVEKRAVSCGTAMGADG